MTPHHVGIQGHDHAHATAGNLGSLLVGGSRVQRVRDHDNMSWMVESVQIAGFICTRKATFRHCIISEVPESPLRLERMSTGTYRVCKIGFTVLHWNRTPALRTSGSSTVTVSPVAGLNIWRTGSKRNCRYQIDPLVRSYVGALDDSAAEGGNHACMCTCGGGTLLWPSHAAVSLVLVRSYTLGFCAAACLPWRCWASVGLFVLYTLDVRPDKETQAR